MAKFSGYWHIAKMSTWGEEYCNMEVQVFIEINGLSGSSSLAWFVGIFG
jgi:hypothetical protein